MTTGSRGALVDGLPARQGALARARRRAQRLTVSRAELDEAEIERQLLAHPGVTRANTLAVMSPTGGVGKTTCTFLIGTLLATHLKLRVIAVDANPGSGTLADLVPPKQRSHATIAQLLNDADRLFTAAEINPYVSRLATGLHVLGARHDRDRGPDQYGELLALLSCFYEVIMLDLGPGVVGPLPRLAARRANQIVLVTTPDWMTSMVMLDARAYLNRPDKTLVAINRTRQDATAAERPYRAAILPQDGQLAAMLETGTYSLGALPTPTRAAIKRLGHAVATELR